MAGKIGCRPLHVDRDLALRVVPGNADVLGLGFTIGVGVAPRTSASRRHDAVTEPSGR
jgi:hypothetical protein